MQRGGKEGGGEGGHTLEGGVQKRRYCHGLRFLPEGSFMMSIPVLTFCALDFDEGKIKINFSADCTIKENMYMA